LEGRKKPSTPSDLKAFADAGAFSFYEFTPIFPPFKPKTPTGKMKNQ